MTSLTLLDLPGEIRNQIYHELLVLPWLSTSKSLHDYIIYPEILQICRKIHEEAKQILYGCNTFLAHPNLLSSMPRLRQRFSTFGHAHLISMIRRYHISVRLDCDPNFSAKKAQEAFTGVEELTLEVFQAQFWSSDYKVLKLFEGIRGVKKARIYGSVQAFPDYVYWLERAMMATESNYVENFGEVGALNVRLYDMWIVSANLASNENNWAYDFAAWWSMNLSWMSSRQPNFRLIP
jgi:hypothetical protein